MLSRRLAGSARCGDRMLVGGAPTEEAHGKLATSSRPVSIAYRKKRPHVPCRFGRTLLVLHIYVIDSTPISTPDSLVCNSLEIVVDSREPLEQHFELWAAAQSPSRRGQGRQFLIPHHARGNHHQRPHRAC